LVEALETTHRPLPGTKNDSKDKKIHK